MKEMKEWFKSNTHCPMGCGDICFEKWKLNFVHNNNFCFLYKNGESNKNIIKSLRYWKLIAFVGVFKLREY